MDYDHYSCTKPVAGTAAGVAMDGTNDTANIDTLGFNSITFVVNLSAAVQYDAVTWGLEHSDDGAAWAAIDADDLLFRTPKDATQTSDIFHCGYRGKKRYVRAAFTSGGAETGQITAMMGHPYNAPFDQAEIEE